MDLAAGGAMDPVTGGAMELPAEAVAEEHAPAADATVTAAIVVARH